MIVQGDALSVLKNLPDGFVNCCITSPPYWGLRDYGVDGQLGLESTPEEYTENLVEVFREVKRVLKADGTFWLNLGDSYTSRDPGKSIIHPAYVGESFGEGKRPMTPQGLKQKDLVGIPWRVAFALQADGWYLRQDIIWHKPNPMPESVTDRCTKSHEYIFLLSKSKKYYYDHEAIKEPAGVKGNANSFRGGAYCNGNKDNASLGKRTVSGNTKVRIPTGWDTNKGSHRKMIGRYDNSKIVHGNKPGRSDLGKACNNADLPMKNKRSVWTIATKPFKAAHFATFPPKLIEPCILAGCPEGGIVLDPFAGAGTVELVAKQHGRSSIGIELNPDYVSISAERLI